MTGLTFPYIQRAMEDGALPSWTAPELRELLEWIDARREELNSIELAVRWELDMDGTEEIKAQINLDAAAMYRILKVAVLLALEDIDNDLPDLAALRLEGVLTGLNQHEANIGFGDPQI